MLNNKNLKTALILRDKGELDFFGGVVSSMGFKTLDQYDNSLVAFENSLKTQYGFFMMRIEMAGLSGLSLIQKLRATGNYGLETVLIIADQLNAPQFNVLSEYDVNYVLIKPFTVDRIVEKINYIMKIENSLSASEQKYREAKAAFIGGMIDMAHQYAVELTEENPKSEKSLILLGDVALKRGQVMAAKLIYKKALEANPSSAVAAIKLAHAFVKEGDYATAAELTQTLSTKNPFNINLLVDAGLSNYELGNIPQAKKFSQEVIDLDKHNKEGRELLASSYIKEENFDESCNILMESHSEKDLIGFFNNKGVEYSREGQFSKAIEMYKMCLKKFKENPYLYVIEYNIALAAIKGQNPDMARPFLERSLALKPDFEKAKALMAKVFNKTAD